MRNYYHVILLLFLFFLLFPNSAIFSQNQCCISRTVSNPVDCNSGRPTTFFIYEHNRNNTFYRITSGHWIECADGTARFTGTSELGSFNILLSGRTFSGHPNRDGCRTDRGTGDYYYYTSLSGNIGNFSISPRGNVQVGTGATIQRGSFGASGWFTTQQGWQGDFDINLSGTSRDIDKLRDSDRDGVCDSQDCAPNNPNLPGRPGESCNDSNPNTVNDVIQSDGCTCRGTTRVDCPNLSANIGDPCNDGNPNTINDRITSNCQCRGTRQFDCPDLSLNIGDPCNDFDNSTVNDRVQSNCQCRGTRQFDCPNLSLNIGDPCNDFDNSTVNDRVQSNCQCRGTRNFDCPNLSLNIGDSCNDFDNSTVNDRVQSNCQCRGTRNFDCPNLSLNIGDPCNDFNHSTTNDRVRSNCQCRGDLSTGDCNLISVTAEPGSVIVSGLQNGPIAHVQVFSAAFQSVFSCANNCDPTQVINNLPPGTYHVFVSFYDAAWNRICEVRRTITVGSTTTGGTTGGNTGGTTTGGTTGGNTGGTTMGGTTTGGGMTRVCGSATISSNGNSITISNSTGQRYFCKIDRISPTYESIVNCTSQNCAFSNKTLTNLTAGNYIIKLYTAEQGNDFWRKVCEDVHISIGGFLTRGGGSISRTSNSPEDEFSFNTTLDKSQLLVYPNPAKEELFIAVPNHINQPAQIRLVNQFGQIIRDVRVDEMEQELPVRLELFDVPSGFYFISIQSGEDKILMKKIIIGK